MSESADQNFSFRPPAGGDVSLKSSDGTIFVVHSLLLSLASKVFSDMFASTTKADVVELAEDAEAISLMLAFIYPVVRPPVDTIPLLEKAMLVAHKYDVEGLAKSLEQNQQRALIRCDPARVFRLAADYGFREMQTLAAMLIGSSKLDLLEVDGLLQFSKEFPGSAHIIGVVGAQGARARILDGLLTDSGPKRLLDDQRRDLVLPARLAKRMGLTLAIIPHGPASG
ncbi:hypothetical protein FRC10_000217 [Ceratobasidium sp. 414]|nr:hypothetical protein FRC10_000217 [Ceratobasidium sp. 414]